MENSLRQVAVLRLLPQSGLCRGRRRCGRRAARCQATAPPVAPVIGGAGGPPRDGMGGGGLGGGPGGEGDSAAGDDGGEGPTGILGKWRGWQERVAADPSFPYKVFIEQVIGVGAAVLGDMSSRPHWGLYELDFVFSTLVVGSLVNFSLMYFLAPTAGGASAGGGLLQRLFSERTLTSWGAPGGHMFQPGFGLSMRLVNLLYKGLMFASVGLAAGLVGTGLSNGLLALRKRLDPSYESPNENPNVLLNASSWAVHMGLSSNTRYQLINGFDMVMEPRLPGTTFRVVTSVLRTLNNMAGGISFVVTARLLGAQSAGGAQPAEVALEPGSTKARARARGASSGPPGGRIRAVHPQA